MRSNRPYVQLDPAVIEQARQMDLLSYLKRYEPNNLKRVASNVYCTKEHDSLKISNGKWYWWSRGFGGVSALDYLIKVKEHSFVEAVELLTGITADWKPPPVPVPKDEPKELLLPPKNKDCNRVTEYLFGRGIDLSIIQDCIADGTIFESSKYQIMERITENSYAVKFSRFTEPQRTVKVFRVKGSLKGVKKIGGLRGLYLHYCYKLGILPKNKKQNYARLHYLLKDDLMKMEAITQETRLLCRNRIDTVEQLLSYKGSLETEKTDLLQKRKELYSISRKTGGEEKEAIRSQLSDLSKHLSVIRKEVRLCESIEDVTLLSKKSYPPYGQMKNNNERS